MRGRRTEPVVAALRVTAEPAPHPGTVTVRWEPAVRAESARILLCEPDGAGRRLLVTVGADAHGGVDVALAGTAPSAYAIEVELYSSGSWGGGRLVAAGRSVSLRDD